MKKSIWILVLLGVLALSGCETMMDSGPGNGNSVPLPKQPSDDMAMIYIVRPDIMGALIKFDVFVDSKKPELRVGGTIGGQYIYFEVSPGTHTILSQAENLSRFVIQTQAGQTYFIQQVPTMGILFAENHMQLMENSTGANYVSHLKAGDIDGKYKPLVAEQKAETPDELSADDAARLAKYKAASGTLVIDNISSGASAFFEASAETEAYEGMQLLSLLGLNKTLSISDQLHFIQALFVKVPSDNTAGTTVRYIIIPSYFADKSPLIIDVTTAFSGDHQPAIAALYNVSASIRSDGADAAKKKGPSVALPRGYRKDGHLTFATGDTYAFTVLSDGRVSGSSAIGKTLSPLLSVKDLGDRLNLADEYLRGTAAYDKDQMLKELARISVDPTTDPIIRAFAHAQLFEAQLFNRDYPGAAQTITDTLGSKDLADPTVSTSDLGFVLKNDMPNIYRIARALATGDEGELSKAF